MKTFIIVRTYKHTEELEIEADSEEEAIALAEDAEFERNHDDWLYDETVRGY